MHQMASITDLLFVFMLAGFLGFQLIKRVSPLLHSPLMSLTNAIAAVVVVGAIMVTGEEGASPLARTLGFIAVTAATINAVSGFLITDRMLKMFRKKGKRDDDRNDRTGRLSGRVRALRLGPDVDEQPQGCSPRCLGW